MSISSTPFGSAGFGRPTEVFTISALVAEANRRLESHDFVTEPLTERTVRHYISRGLMQKGYTRTQLAPDTVVHQADDSLSGNTRYFIVDDIDAAVGIKLKIAQGRSLDEIGFAGRDRSQVLREASYSPDSSWVADQPIVSRMVSHREITPPASEARGLFSGSPRSRSVDRPEPEISPDSATLPEVVDTWVLELRPGLTLHGEGDKPSPAAIRRLTQVARETVPAPLARRPRTPGRVRIDIELNDIVAPFNGVVVNASNADLRPGGGVAGRIWEVCGDDELTRERIRVQKALPLRPGDAVFTGPGRGADLGFTGIIHALGPRWLSGFDRARADRGEHQLSEHGEEDALIRTWRTVLRVADTHNTTQFTAPMISSGIFGYPVPDNFEIAFTTLYTTTTSVERVVIRTISRKTFEQLTLARRMVRETLDIA